MLDSEPYHAQKRKQGKDPNLYQSKTIFLICPNPQQNGQGSNQGLIRILSELDPDPYHKAPPQPRSPHREVNYRPNVNTNGTN